MFCVTRRGCVPVTVDLRPRSSLGISRRDPTFAEPVQNGHAVYTQVPTNSGERPTLTVEMDGVINLVGRQATAAHRYVMPMKDLADRPPLDTEPGSQLIHRRSTLIASDQLPNLSSVELACPLGFGPGSSRRHGRTGIRKLPNQRLQRFYLAFRVVVDSPKVHTSQAHALGEHEPFAFRVFCGGEAPHPPGGLRARTPGACGCVRWSWFESSPTTWGSTQTLGATQGWRCRGDVEGTLVEVEHQCPGCCLQLAA